MNQTFRPPRRQFLKLAPASLLLTGAAVALHAPAARAQAFPAKPVTLIVPYPAGGATDVQMRALALATSKRLGQPIVIVNQPGVGGTLGPAAMARTASPDGYTISVINAALFRLPHIQRVSYNALTDFTFIMGLNSYVYGVSVAADSRWKRVEDMIAYARANPGKVSIASVGNGTSGHIATERLAKMAGIKVNFVPFKGGADALVALIGGHVDAMIEAGWGAMAESGKVRLLAVALNERLKRWPQVPTLKELGYDIAIQSEVGLAGPKGMPPAVVQALHDAFKASLSDPGYQQALQAESMPNVYLSTAEYRQYAQTQFASDKRFVEELGIRLAD